MSNPKRKPKHEPEVVKKATAGKRKAPPRQLADVVQEIIPPVPTRGRPSLYRPEYCHQIVDFCGKGYSITGFAGEIGVSRQTISEWETVHPDFSVAVKVAKAKAALKWEQRSNNFCDVGGPPGSPTLVIFNLKNFAPDEFRERQEVAHTVDVSVEERRRRHIEIINGWEAEAQERREKEEGA